MEPKRSGCCSVAVCTCCGREVVTAHIGVRFWTMFDCWRQLCGTCQRSHLADAGDGTEAE